MTPNEYLYVFSSLTLAVFVEAVPFLAVGAIISSILEVYFPPDLLARLIPKRPAWGVLLGLGAGLIMPTCECGVVPVARRLLSKGVPPHVAVTYMLAAPVINPVVLVSTWVAFRGNVPLVLGRAVVSAVIAVCLGSVLTRVRPTAVLRPGTLTLAMAMSHDHAHDHGHGAHQHESATTRSRLVDVFYHAASEFLDMGRYLILGAFAAGLFKTFVPGSVIGLFSQNLFLSVAAMMLLAVLLSVCSEADAFVAASFSTLPQAAQLAFVTIGPVVDLKLIGMFAATFHHRVFLALIIVPTILVYVLSVAFGLIGG